MDSERIPYIGILHLSPKVREEPNYTENSHKTKCIALPLSNSILTSITPPSHVNNRTNSQDHFRQLYYLHDSTSFTQSLFRTNQPLPFIAARCYHSRNTIQSKPLDRGQLSRQPSTNGIHLYRRLARFSAVSPMVPEQRSVTNFSQQ